MKYGRFNKPPLGVHVDWTHSLARGLFSCYLLNERTGTHLNNSVGTSHGSTLATIPAAWSSNADGPTLQLFHPQAQITLGSAESMFGAKVGDVLSELTVVCRYRKTPETSFRRGKIFGPYITAADTASIMHASIPQQGGDVIWAVGGTATTNYVSATEPQFDHDVWVFTCGSVRGMEIWQNGTILAGDSTKSPTWTVPDTTFSLGKSISDTGLEDYDGDLGEFSFFMTYNRVLTPDEIAQISTNPYSMFNTRFFYKNLIQVGGADGGARAGSSGLVNFNFSPRGGVKLGSSAPNTILDWVDGTGGAVCGGYGYRTWNYTGAGGARSGGYGYLSTFLTTSGGVRAGGIGYGNIELFGKGGIRAGGTGSQTFWDWVNGSGGAVCSGRSINLKSWKNLNATGGAVAGGLTGLLFIRLLPVSRQGVRAGGSHTFLYLCQPQVNSERIYLGGGARHTLISHHYVSGGAVLSSSACGKPVIIIQRFGDGGAKVAGSHIFRTDFSPRGGVRIAGSSPHTFWDWVNGTGGAVATGSSAHTMVMLSNVRGGAVVAGQSRIERRRFTEAFRRNVALVMVNDNIFKDAETAKTAKTRIMDPFGVPTPTA
jgi:hypothetical protein